MTPTPENPRFTNLDESSLFISIGLLDSARSTLHAQMVSYSLNHRSRKVDEILEVASEVVGKFESVLENIICDEDTFTVVEKAQTILTLRKDDSEQRAREINTLTGLLLIPSSDFPDIEDLLEDEINIPDFDEIDAEKWVKRELKDFATDLGLDLTVFINSYSSPNNLEL